MDELKPFGDVLLQTAAYLAAAAFILGVVGRVLKPWVKTWVEEKILVPLQESHRTLTVNSHKDPDNPTIRDDMDTLKQFQTAIGEQVDRIEAKVDESATKADAAALNAAEAVARVDVVALWGENHQTWSEAQLRRVDAALEGGTDERDNDS